MGVEVGYGEDMRKREEKRKENKEIQTKNRDESGEGCVCALKCERWKKMSEVKKEERKKQRGVGGITCVVRTKTVRENRKRKKKKKGRGVVLCCVILLC